MIAHILSKYLVNGGKHFVQSRHSIRRSSSTKQDGESLRRLPDYNGKRTSPSVSMIQARPTSRMRTMIAPTHCILDGNPGKPRTVCHAVRARQRELYAVHVIWYGGSNADEGNHGPQSKNGPLQG